MRFKLVRRDGQIDMIRAEKKRCKENEMQNASISWNGEQRHDATISKFPFTAQARILMFVLSNSTTIYAIKYSLAKTKFQCEYYL